MSKAEGGGEAGAGSVNVCPGCGARFTCGMNAGHAQCWCTSLPATLAVPNLPAGSTAACFCPDCLGRRANGEPQIASTKLQ